MSSESLLDVVIIGAGAAGLTAAYDLQRGTNYTYKILEANVGIGGRLQKLTTLADFPIDIGGEWIHVDPSILNDIHADPSKKVTDYVATVPYIDTYFEYDGFSWLESDYPDEDFKFVNYTWFDYFNDWIAPGVKANVELNCKVNDIDWSSVPVELACTDGRLWTAKHVIITTSIKLLQENDINFTPELPETTRGAINEYIMMDGLKVFMSFEERFYREAWEIDESYTIGDSTLFFYSAAYGQTTSANVLGMVAVGEPAAKYVNMADEEIIDDVLGELDALYDGQATPNYIDGHVQNWNQQVFVRGAYSYLSDDDEVYEAIPTLREPLGNKLFFAGEAVPADSLENGFAHGAALSGRAAAQAVQVLLNDDSTEQQVTDATQNNSAPPSSIPSSPSSAATRTFTTQISIFGFFFSILAWM